MKRLGSALLAGAVAVLVSAAPAGAQYIFLGGGATIPVSDYKDFAKTGWIATGGVGFDIGSRGLWVELQGYYGSNKHEGTSGDKTDLLSGMGALGYTFSPEAKVTPWVMAGVGFLSHKFKPGSGGSSSSTSFAYEAGAGLAFMASSRLHIWTGGQFTSGTGDNSGTKFISLLLGVSIGIGGGGM